MVYDGTIRFNTKIDEASFNKGVSSLTKGLGSVKSILTGIGIAWGVEKVAQVLFSVGKQSISLASDLQEVQNVVDVSFGSMKQNIEDFAETSIENFGMSELSAKKTASTYMAIAKAMDINSDKASDMSINLTGLTGDMASFYNVTQDVADTALKSIFTGETETLKRFGIVMTQANLEAFAFKNGITKSYQAMTEAEKVQLRYYYVLNATKLAQGDFARTSDSWANQTRVLSENFKELLTILGGGLIQILTPVVKFLNYVVEGLIEIFTWLGRIYTMLTGKKFIKESGNATVALNDITDSAIGASDAQDGLADSVTDTGKAIKKQLANFDELNVLQKQLSGGSGVADFSNINFDGLNTPGTSSQEDSVRGLKKEMDDFFILFENRYKRLKQELLIPIKVPAPQFSELPNPVWKPNYGLEDVPTLVPAPNFEPLPSPVWAPNWGLYDSLFAEGEKTHNYSYSWGVRLQESFAYTKTRLSEIAAELETNIKYKFASFQGETEFSTMTWGERLRISIAETGENVRVNTEALAKAIATNFENWRVSSKQSVEAWKKDVSRMVYQTSYNALSNINAWLQSSSTNVVNWARSTGETLQTWGNGVVGIAHETAVNFVTALVDGLKTAWQKIKEYAQATGEKISGSFNGGFSIPSIGAIALGVLGTIGASLNLNKGGFVPAFAKGAVIPPNGEFMAILGDQKYGRNIETPESLLRDIMKEELANSGGNGNMIIIVKLGDETITERVVNNINRKSRISGKTVITV